MTAFNPVLSTQIFKIDPQAFGSCSGMIALRTHVFDIRVWQITRKSCNHDGRRREVGCMWPMDDFDTINVLSGSHGYARLKSLKTVQVIDPKSDPPVMLALQLPHESPGHADIAKVIDDPAKNICAHD
jgi:hypothetical protein